jgi:peptide subunit release factor RF-3
MNKMDVLLKTPLLLLNIEQRLEIKKIGVHHPRDFKHQQSGKNQIRSFHTSWFDKQLWLTVSEDHSCVS